MIHLKESETMQMGWALKQRKKNTKFSRAQVKFLLEIYNKGEIPGEKERPFQCCSDDEMFCKRKW